MKKQKHPLPPGDPLHLLEKAKKQYEQYVEVSKLYDLNSLVNPKKEAVYRPATTSFTSKVQEGK